MTDIHLLMEHGDTVKQLLGSVQSKQKLSESLADKIVSSGIPWSSWLPITQHAPIGGKTLGIYRIRYKPSIEIMYYGEGRINNRIDKAYGVWVNGGEARSDSPCRHGNKMYARDSKVGNWQFSYYAIDLDCKESTKSLSEDIEKLLVERDAPAFNNKSMTGLRK
tara:strand:+ start:140 stop:631 length:492 start_codon:yes stop_codon:yes gene_type:complete